jgi:tRNA (uracil-5-)-methyltransferase TRM9
VNRETVDALDALNRAFYATHAEDFLATRAGPWPGWNGLLPHLRELARPDAPIRILDVGCGNARFGGWLGLHLERPHRYTGLDRSLPLLARARTDDSRQPPPRLLCDIVRSAGALPCRAASFDAVLGLAFLHHVPSFDLRRALICDLLRVLRPGGVLAISFWQFAEEERFRRRIVDLRHLDRAKAPAIDAHKLEDGDHLLAWGELSASSPRSPSSVRYCHHTSPEEADRLLAGQPATLVESYRADGRSGQLDLYRVWRRA